MNLHILLINIFHFISIHHPQIMTYYLTSKQHLLAYICNSLHP